MAADFDFNELDKTISSLMSGVAESAVTLPDEDNVKTLDIGSTLGVNEKPKFENLGEIAGGIGGLTVEQHDDVQPAEIPAAVESVQAQPSATAAELSAERQAEEMSAALRNVESETPKSATIPPAEQAVITGAALSQTPVQQPTVPRPANGKFLDVMNNSSDMSTPNTSPLEPSVIKPASQAPAATVNVPRGSLIQPVVSGASPALAPVPPPPVVRPQPAPKVTPVVPKTPAKDLPPVASPFLADAQVDKRPLGNSVAPSPGFEDSVRDGVDEDSLHPLNAGVGAVSDALLKAKELQSIESRIIKPKASPKSIQEIESADTGVKEHVDSGHSADSIGGITIDKLDKKTRAKILGTKKKKSNVSVLGIISVLLTVLAIATALGYLLFRQQ